MEDIVYYQNETLDGLSEIITEIKSFYFTKFNGYLIQNKAVMPDNLRKEIDQSIGSWIMEMFTLYRPELAKDSLLSNNNFFRNLWDHLNQKVNETINQG